MVATVLYLIVGICPSLPLVFATVSFLVCELYLFILMCYLSLVFFLVCLLNPGTSFRSKIITETIPRSQNRSYICENQNNLLACKLFILFSVHKFSPTFLCFNVALRSQWGSREILNSLKLWSFCDNSPSVHTYGTLCMRGSLLSLYMGTCGRWYFVAFVYQKLFCLVSILVFGKHFHFGNDTEVIIYNDATLILDEIRHWTMATKWFTGHNFEVERWFLINLLSQIVALITKVVVSSIAIVVTSISSEILIQRLSFITWKLNSPDVNKQVSWLERAFKKGI